MAFPGGRVEDSDADPLTAAVRETAEELALDLAAEAQLIGRLSSVPVMAHGRRLPMVIEPFVFDLGSADPPMQPNHEVDEIHWIPLPFFADPTNRELFLWRRGDLSVHLPCYHWEGNKVWGLTLGMVDELMAL